MASIQAKDIKVRMEKDRLVADVSNGEGVVDTNTELAAEAKKASVIWDGSKAFFREVAKDTFSLLESEGKSVKTLYFLGHQDKVIEVAASKQRKGLPEELAQEAITTGFSSYIAEENTLVLKGELALWGITALGDRTGDPNFNWKKEKVLTPVFEEVRQNLRMQKMGNTPMLDRLTQSGLFAPAVEAKVRKG